MPSDGAPWSDGGTRLVSRSDDGVDPALLGRPALDRARRSAAGDDGRTADTPTPAAPRPDSGARETITINEREYVGVVRFDIEVAGTYEVSVFGEPSDAGEVLLSRPIGDLFGQWPWFLAIAAGGIVAVIGVVMWIVGGVNRSRARRADTT